MLPSATSLLIHPGAKMALRSPWQRQHEGRTSQQRDACPALQRQLSPAACTARALMLHAKTLEEQSFLSAGRSLLLTLYKRLLINLLAVVVILLAAVGVDLRRSIQPSGKVQEKRSLSMGSNLQAGLFQDLTTFERCYLSTRMYKSPWNIFSQA